MSRDPGIVRLGGKDYHTVAKRIADFRAAFPIGEGWGITTEIVVDTEKRVVVRAIIVDPQGRTVAAGIAEEQRGRGVNASSALENCETSAIGRALAAAGYVGSGHYASADEVIAAQQRRTEPDRQPEPEPRRASSQPAQPDTEAQRGPNGVPVPDSFTDEHHPEWPESREAFCTAISRDCSVTYEAISGWLEERGLPRPSRTSTAYRRALYTWLRFNGGAEAVRAAG